MKRYTLAIVLLLLAIPSWAAGETAGKTVFVVGTVTAQRDEPVALKKDDPVYEKDVIVTAARSRAQLLMRDGAKFALRPETEFRIEEYFQAGDEREQPDGSVVVTADDSAITELIKGGFRTITGAVGRDDPDAYEIRTPAATMGIRGTHYSVVWCAGDCELPPGIRSARRILDGLYVGVTEGIVSVVNNAGDYLLRAGEYAYVRDRNTAPQRLRDMPPALIDTGATDIGDSELAGLQLRDTIQALGPNAPGVGLGSPDPAFTGTTTRFTTRSQAPPPSTDDSLDPLDSLTERPDTVDDDDPLTKPPGRPILTVGGLPLTGGTLPNIRPVTLASPTAAAGVFTASSPQGLRTFAGNDLIAFQAPFPGTMLEPVFAIGTAGIRDDGFDPVTGFGWGRWTGGTAAVTPTSGSVTSLDLGAQSLHWVYGPMLTARPVMPVTGTANFTLIAGNTDPTDTLGNSGVLGNATLMANFTTSTVVSNLSLGIGGSEWLASGSGTIGNELFNGVYDNVTVGGRAGGAGSFSGFFGAPGANGFPIGAGLTYGLTDMMGVSVSGAVVFGEPTVP